MGVSFVWSLILSCGFIVTKMFVVIELRVVKHYVADT